MSVGPIHHAVLSVADLDRSVAFYRDLLGFRVSVSGAFHDDAHVRSFRLPAGSGGRSASVHPKGATAGIVELVEWSIPGGVASTGPKRAGDVPGVWALAFEVPADELVPLRERLLAADVPVYSEPVAHRIDGYGSIAWFGCEDPDGMLLEMIALPSVDEVRRARAAEMIALPSMDEVRRARAAGATGDPTVAQAGKPAGDRVDDPTGPEPGDRVDDPTGPEPGGRVDDPTGPEPGGRVDDPTGPEPGDRVDDPTGPEPGDRVDDPAGPEPGDRAGAVAPTRPPPRTRRADRWRP